MFIGGKPLGNLMTTGGSPNFTIQILTVSHDINKESELAGICQSSFTHKKISDEKFATFSIRQTSTLYNITEPCFTQAKIFKEC